MKDMLREMAKDVKTHKDDKGGSAAEVTSFVEKARRGSVANEDIFKFAKLFKVRRAPRCGGAHGLLALVPVSHLPFRMT